MYYLFLLHKRTSEKTSQKINQPDREDEAIQFKYWLERTSLLLSLSCKKHGKIKLKIYAVAHINEI
jgi:hypothetical protein